MSSFQIREAQENDFAGMAKVRVDTWKATYKGIVPDDFLESLSYRDVSKRWQKTFWEERDPRVGVFVAEGEQNEIVGIAICGPEQSHDLVYQSEIYVLYVLPAYQNRGIGRRLVRACVQHLIQTLSAETLLIWVIAENPYRGFYESLGGKMVREKTQVIGGKMILEVGYGWQELSKIIR